MVLPAACLLRKLLALGPAHPRCSLCSCLPEQKLNFGVMVLRGLFKVWLSAYQDRLRLAEAAGAAEAGSTAPPKARSAALIASSSLCALECYGQDQVALTEAANVSGAGSIAPPDQLSSSHARFAGVRLDISKAAPPSLAVAVSAAGAGSAAEALSGEIKLWPLCYCGPWAEWLKLDEAAGTVEGGSATPSRAH